MRSLLFGMMTCTFLYVLAPATAMQCFANDTALKAGVAVREITPQEPMGMAGYYSERLSTGTLDPLLAKTMVFRQGETTAVLTVMDLITVPPLVTTVVREQLHKNLNIPPENVIITATHSHTGPMLDRLTRQRPEEPDALQKYSLYVADQIIKAATDAYQNATPVTLAAGATSETRLSFNRRFFMKSGGPVRFNPGVKNPDILKAAGPIDPEVDMLLVRNAGNNAPLTSLTVFAIHADTTGGMQFSGDYSYYVSNVLRKKYGDAFVSVFGIGTCGDINHIDTSGETAIRKAPEIGTMLGETVAAKLDELKKCEKPSLRVVRKTIQVPMKTFTDEEIAEAEQLRDKVMTEELPFLDRVQIGVINQIAERRNVTGDLLTLEVHAIRLDENTAIVTLPGEVFVDIGLAIKKASPFETTFVMELANDAIPYMPTEKAFREGSYETINSVIAPGGGEMMQNAAIAALKEVHGQ